MRKILIKQANIINVGKTTLSDLLIVGVRIKQISTSISDKNDNGHHLNINGSKVKLSKHL